MIGRRPVTRGWLLAAAVALAAVAVAVGVLIGHSVGGHVASGTHSLAARPAPGTGAGAPPGFVEVRDAQTGVAIGLPPGWRPLPATDPSVRLVAASGDGFGSLLLRAVPLPTGIEQAGAGAQEELTRRLVTSNRGVRLLEGPRPVALGGLHGFFYFYTFTDASGRLGAHSHYFLFKGPTLVTLVFQALPAARFAGLSSTFDRIAGTFRGAG